VTPEEFYERLVRLEERVEELSNRIEELKCFVEKQLNHNSFYQRLILILLAAVFAALGINVAIPSP